MSAGSDYYQLRYLSRADYRSATHGRFPKRSHYGSFVMRNCCGLMRFRFPTRARRETALRARDFFSHALTRDISTSEPLRGRLFNKRYHIRETTPAAINEIELYS